MKRPAPLRARKRVTFKATTAYVVYVEDRFLPPQLALCPPEMGGSAR